MGVDTEGSAACCSLNGSSQSSYGTDEYCSPKCTSVTRPLTNVHLWNLTKQNKLPGKCSELSSNCERYFINVRPSFPNVCFNHLLANVVIVNEV